MNNQMSNIICFVRVQFQLSFLPIQDHHSIRQLGAAKQPPIFEIATLQGSVEKTQIPMRFSMIAYALNTPTRGREKSGGVVLQKGIQLVGSTKTWPVGYF